MKHDLPRKIDNKEEKETEYEHWQEKLEKDFTNCKLRITSLHNLN